jgi:hypothetical protein
MTVRYSYLSPDFVQDAVDKLAPQAQDDRANLTDTTLTQARWSQRTRRLRVCIKSFRSSTLQTTRP